MKTQERAYPDLVQATRQARTHRTVTGEAAAQSDTGEEVEVGADWIEPVESGEVTSPAKHDPARVFAAGGDDPPESDRSARRRINNNPQNAGINVERDPRATPTSP